MNLSEEQKKCWLHEYLKIIFDISDIGYQRRIWVRNEGPECQDFDGAVNDFFDVGDPILEQYQAFGITENQYQILKRLRDEFKKFSKYNDLPQLFIDTPEWIKITLMAKKVLEEFNYHK